jgi:hypothetical protein
MKITPVMASLSAITGGVLGAGTVPLERLARASLHFSSASNVTVTTAGQNIVPAQTLVLQDRDLVLVTFWAIAQRNVTAGTATLTITTPGLTAGILPWDLAPGAGKTTGVWSFVSQNNYSYMTWLGKCGLAGNLVLQIDAQMVGAGSQALCATNDVKLDIWAIQ